MRSVFLMEDIVFMLHEMAALPLGRDGNLADKPPVSGTAWRRGTSLADDRF